jgi:hypothetical protein
LEFKNVTKGVFIDGHEREDVVKYRQREFIPAIDQLRDYLVTWNSDGEMNLPSNLPAGEKPHILVTHDESTFNANDGKRKLWTQIGRQPIRPKGKGRGIMVSDFITAGGRLMVPWTISEDQLGELGLPRRYATHYLEYSKDNYWTSDAMVDHAIQVAIPIFEVAFPGCIAVFAFDNASNHACFAPDALRAEKLNKGPGGAQPIMRDGFIHQKDISQAMQFPENYHIRELAGKPKGLKQILKERGLWHREYYTTCPTTLGRPGCSPEGMCCARKILAKEQDFREQKGRLQEEIEARRHKVIFYPKFHCELNPIESYWCKAKWYAREYCDYSLEGLRRTVPKALASVDKKSIWGFFNRSMRILEAYRDGLQYGCEEFKNRVYKAHRRIEDKSKW